MSTKRRFNRETSEPMRTPVVEKVATVKRPPLPEKRQPATGAAIMTFDVFARLCGVKPDELAGFRFWARQNLPPRQTLSEWRAQHQIFQDRPVR